MLKDFKLIDEFISHSQIAAFPAKEPRRDSRNFISPLRKRIANSRAKTEYDLRQAIEAKQFLLHYQPQFRRGQVTGVEALLRWAHPTRGLLLPDEFIRVAEETGLILPLGHWVLQSVCEQLATWGMHHETASIRVAINVSALQLQDPHYVETVHGVIRATGANPRNLNLELTESLLVEHTETAKFKMEQLKLLGCEFSLDDFGTGYSSLNYLKQLPFDYLKIDRSFVRDIAVDKKSKAIARSIVSLGRALGLTVIAEGVETEQQRDCLLRIGCRDFQGFLFSRPVPLNELEQIVSGHTSSLASNDGTQRKTQSLHPREPMPVFCNHCASPSEDCYYGSAVGR